LIIGRQLRNFPARKPYFNCLFDQPKLLQYPRVHAVFAEFFFQVPDAGKKSAIFKSAIGVACAEASAVRAVQHVYDVGARNRSQHCRFEGELAGVFAGLEFEEVDLQPGTAVELDLEHDGLADERVERVRTYVAHGCGASVGVGVDCVAGKETVVIAPGLQEAAARDFPAPVTVGAVIQEDFVDFGVVVSAGPVSSELS